MITRFAPSPTGRLHLGHAFSALTARDMAHAVGGRFLLRIEDIDRARSTREHEAAIFEDLAWLGLDWPRPVMRQSERMAAYGEAIGRLGSMGVLYPCACTRGDIRAALAAPQEGAAAPAGPDGPIYPGTCRGRPFDSWREGEALRLDVGRAAALIGAAPLAFEETGAHHRGRHLIAAQDLARTIGDVVLARRDIGTSYHLAVVVDDAAQEITHVVRGEDLFEATAIHVLLQRLLGLATPVYHHHRLIRDEAGRRLAKRDDARALSLYRARGATPGDIRRLVGLPAG